MRGASCLVSLFVFVASTVSHPCKADSVSTATLWPIHFNSVESGQMEVKYNLSSIDDTLTISASVGYLDALRMGKPITAINFYYSPFHWSLPRLSVKTENSTDHEILLEKVVFDVRESKVDRTPIPIVLNELIEKVGFYNDGWGDMVDVEFEVGLLGDGYCHGPQVVDRAAFSKMSFVKIGRVDNQYSLDVRDLIAAGNFRPPTACAVGTLKYKDENGGSWHVVFRAGVWIGPPLAGAPAPPNTNYDLFLRAGQSGYTTELPVSQSVPAKGVDHFQISVYSDKSATFDLIATVVSSRGQEVAKSRIKLAYFRPRSASTPITPWSKYKDLDRQVFDVKSLAPYITDIRYDPVDPDRISIGIQATEEWMLLSNAKRNALQVQIEEALVKLGLQKGYYCYRLNSEQCVRSGSFEWKKQ
jgi:hypothetical protein